MNLAGLADRVRSTIRRHRLATPGTRLLAGVSGGPDSTALAYLLRHLHLAGDLQLVGLVHLNHQLRPGASSDEAHCGRLAAQLGLPLVAGREDVAALARAARASIEDAAHRARHAFFEQARLSLGADAVAVGHTLDDQAETVLLRLMRGAGARGLSGMRPRRGTVIRPLLDCRRAELLAWLTAEGLEWVQDPSNDDPAIPRNRVRAELLPLMARRFNPDVARALAQTAALLRADDEYLDRTATEWCDRHASLEAGSASVEADLLCVLPVALARRVVWRLAAAAGSGRMLTFDHVERALAVAAGTASGADLAGSRVQRVGSRLVLRGRPAGFRGRVSADPRRVPAFAYPLVIPGATTIPEGGCRIEAELAARAPSVEPGGDIAVLPQALVRGTPWLVRNRRPGDRVRPGAGGSRKLQDVLVDRKVPRDERDRIPIVVDDEGRIVWVAGHVQPREFRVTDPAQAVVILRLKGVGGSC